MPNGSEAILKTALGAPWYERIMSGFSAAPGSDTQHDNVPYNAGRILGEWTADPIRKLANAFQDVQEVDPRTEEGMALARSAYGDVPISMAQIGALGSIVPGKPSGALGSNMGEKVFRFSRNAEKPSNSVPYTFWADSPDGLNAVYGPNGWQAETKNMVHIDDIAKEIIGKMQEQDAADLLPAGVTMDYGNELNATNIVDHAGAWDDSQFITWFAENFGDKYPAVKTNNGAIILDDSAINGLKRYSE